MTYKLGVAVLAFNVESQMMYRNTYSKRNHLLLRFKKCKTMKWRLQKSILTSWFDTGTKISLRVNFLMFSYLFSWGAYLTICYVPQHWCQTRVELLNLHKVEVPLYFKYEPQIFFARLILVWVHVTLICYAGCASLPCLSIIPYLISMGKYLLSVLG